MNGTRNPNSSTDSRAARRPSSRLHRRVAVAAVGGAVAFAALGVGTAQASVVSGAVRVPISGLVNKIPLGYVAPTQNLTTVANALTFKNKSVTTAIAAPAGLSLTHPVDISVAYDNTVFLSQSYAKTTGNRFLYNFPSASGQALYKGITVTLVEHVSATQTQHFAITWQPLIEPLYDIRVSPLTFHLDNGCDTFGSSEPVIEWLDPKGVYGEADLSLDGGQSATITNFARTYSEVGQSAGLLHPSVTWWEDDPFSVGAVPSANNGHLLPGSSYTYSQDTQEETGQSCTGRLSYSVTDTLRYYYYL